MMHLQEWGRGDPVIALHPLALESTAFAGVARELAARGLRTVAADLPGFGRTPAPEAPLSPAVLAEPVLEHDWLARAGVRCLYYRWCAATRSAFVSATRERAMDPAFGSQGTWTRLRDLAVPAAFLWCERDALIPRHHAEHVARALPEAQPLDLACSGHFVRGPHYRCFERAVAEAVGALVEAEDGPARMRRRAPISCARLVTRDSEAPESVAGLAEPVR